MKKFNFKVVNFKTFQFLLRNYSHKYEYDDLFSHVRNPQNPVVAENYYDPSFRAPKPPNKESLQAEIQMETWKLYTLQNELKNQTNIEINKKHILNSTASKENVRSVKNLFRGFTKREDHIKKPNYVPSKEAINAYFF
jgi:hypothetical protein